MGHVIKHKSQYSDTDYLILNKVSDPIKAKDLLGLFCAKLGIEMYVYKRQLYNQQCLIVWYSKLKDPDKNYIGPIYTLEIPDGRAFLYSNNVYVEATPSTYELMGALKGSRITKKDVSDFANKVKSIKEKFSKHSEVVTYGDTNTYNVASRKSF